MFVSKMITVVQKRKVIIIINEMRPMLFIHKKNMTKASAYYFAV
jgi:hypothetical protein